jgi:hypothetical protein
MISGRPNDLPSSVNSPRETPISFPFVIAFSEPDHRGSVVVDDRRGLCVRQIEEQPIDGRLSPPACGAGDVVFQIGRMRRPLDERVDGLFRKRRRPEVRVQHGSCVGGLVVLNRVPQLVQNVAAVPDDMGEIEAPRRRLAIRMVEESIG